MIKAGYSNSWNSMRDMRAAFGLKADNSTIEPFLRYWDTLTQEQRHELRRMDLSKLSESDIPAPPKEWFDAEE